MKKKVREKSHVTSGHACAMVRSSARSSANTTWKPLIYYCRIVCFSALLDSKQLNSRNNSRISGSMLILTWVGIIVVIILHRAQARCKILTNIMPTHVKISIEPSIRELFRF